MVHRLVQSPSNCDFWDSLMLVLLVWSLFCRGVVGVGVATISLYYLSFTKLRIRSVVTLLGALTNLSALLGSNSVIPGVSSLYRNNPSLVTSPVGCALCNLLNSLVSVVIR